MQFGLRILPLTIMAAFLLLTVKIADLIEGGDRYSDALLIAQLHAQLPPAEGDVGKKGEDNEYTVSDFTKEGEGKAGEKAEAAASKQEDIPLTERREFSQVEVDILQSLAKRREELEKWEREIETRQGVLAAAEARLDQKIAEVKDLQKQVTELLAQYDEKEQTKIRSLVKIYENMKPKDAARIFEEVEMPILLQVVDQMKEKNAAPILANMNPIRAKELTTELAKQRDLKPKVDAVQ